MTFVRNTRNLLAAAALLMTPCAAVADQSAADGSDDIFWVVELKINDGMEAEYADLIAAMTAEKQGASDVKAYEWLRHGDCVHEFERYEDAAAVSAHLGSFGQFAEDYFKVFTLTGFKVYGPVPDDLKTALKGFGPTYYDLAGDFAH